MYSLTSSAMSECAPLIKGPTGKAGFPEILFTGRDNIDWLDGNRVVLLCSLVTTPTSALPVPWRNFGALSWPPKL